MDVKFIATIECRADNIDERRSQEEIKKMFETLFEEYCGIYANVEVSGLTYINTDNSECGQAIEWGE
jgi:hypothetical protein